MKISKGIVRKKKKIVLLVCVIVVMLIALTITNPTTEDFTAFSEEKYDKMPPPPKNIPVEIERIDFVIFSTYTLMLGYESGITYLGIFGHFFQISEGQFDYPWWLDLFN
ncbi:hypothetical protein ACSVDA_03930 [Cytobacillus sp. Hm23]